VKGTPKGNKGNKGWYVVVDSREELMGGEGML